jgi:hypothetical protein
VKIAKCGDLNINIGNKIKETVKNKKSKILTCTQNCNLLKDSERLRANF